MLDTADAHSDYEMRKAARPTFSLSLPDLLAFSLAVSPILASYRFFIPGLSVGDFLLIICAALTVRMSIFKSVVPLSLLYVLALVGFLSLHSLTIAIFDGLALDSFFRILKLGLTLYFVCLIIEHIKPELLCKYLVPVIYCNLFLLGVQYLVFYGLGRPLPLILPFIPLVNEDISLESINFVLSNSFRPAALFLEPAHLCYFLFFSGAFFFRQNLGKPLLLPIIFGLLLTGSSFGFLSACLLSFLIVWKKSVSLAVLMVGTGFLYFAYLAADVITSIPQLSRLLDPEGVAVTGRLFAGASNIELLNSAQVARGLGYGNFQALGQINGLTYLRLSFGVWGLGFLAIFLISHLFWSGRLIIYKLFLVTTLLFSSMLLTIFMLMAILPFVKNKHESLDGVR